MPVYCNNAIYMLDGETTSVYHLCLTDLTWHQDPNMLFAPRWGRATSDNNKIYAIHADNMQFQCYDVEQKQWAMKCQLPDDTHDNGLSLVAHDGYIYAVGGCSNAICGRFDQQNNNWTMLSKPVILHGYASAVSVGCRIYLLGGCFPDTDAVETYDVEKDEWKVCPTRLPQQLSWFTTAAVTFM